jgi:hypothetical protein
VIRGYASAAAGYVDPAEFPLCAALIRGGSISRHPPPTDLSFCRCAPNRQRAIIFLRDDSALVACGSARTPASPLWFLFNVAALQTASELHLWRRNSSACSRSIMAGGTSSHGIGRLSNEVTATFATQRVHSQDINTKVRLAGSIACSVARVWVGLRRTEAPEVSWKDVQTPTGYQDL